MLLCNKSGQLLRTPRQAHRHRYRYRQRHRHRHRHRRRHHTHTRTHTHTHKHVDWQYVCGKSHCACRSFASRHPAQHNVSFKGNHLGARSFRWASRACTKICTKSMHAVRHKTTCMSTHKPHGHARVSSIAKV